MVYTSHVSECILTDLPNILQGRKSNRLVGPGGRTGTVLSHPTQLIFAGLVQG